jgi:3-deoxy-manno-octulosonate cytidylyltransferase (CMP-KDO synthetase)
MVQWVYERASSAKQLSQVLVATDHEDIRQCVEDFGGKAVMTSIDLGSGTDRVAEAVSNIAADVVINLQGDEPFISAKLLDEMVGLFHNPEIDIATPIHRINNVEDLYNPNLVRVTRDINNFALYFTRSIIPYYRDNPDKQSWLEKACYFKHIGLYAYRKKTLLELTKLPISSLEMAERLEQLRMLENGYSVYTLETDYESMCVDTPDDLKSINRLLQTNRIKPDELL